MLLGMWINVGWMALVAASAIGLLVWGLRRGQFRKIEEPKYRMLEDREPEPWPGSKEQQEEQGND